MASQKIRGTNLLNRVYNPKEMFKIFFSVKICDIILLEIKLVLIRRQYNEKCF